MAFINYTTNQLTIKIVYYGTGLSGKTTNLRYIQANIDRSSRSELICLETETERTFFFDLLPVRAGYIGNFKATFQLMTVPGQVYYEASRKNVLVGTDGLVFVADSQPGQSANNMQSFENLDANLSRLGASIDTTPLVIQFNKRDLPDVLSEQEILARWQASPWGRSGP